MEAAVEAPVRRRGRPKGSKNRKTIAREEARLQRLEPMIAKPEAPIAPLEVAPYPVRAFVDLEKNFKCSCKELLAAGRQHWVSLKGVHLCFVCAGEEVRNNLK